MILSRRNWSRHYFWVLAGGLAGLASMIWVPGFPGYGGAILALLMTAIARSDTFTYRIPDVLNLSAAGLGLVQAVTIAGSDRMHVLGETLISGLVCAGLFLGLRQLYWHLRGIEALGLGDVKLAGVAGVWLTPMSIVWAIEGAALLALLMMALRARSRRRSLRVQRRVAFGAAFAPVIWAAWFFPAITFP